MALTKYYFMSGLDAHILRFCSNYRSALKIIDYSAGFGTRSGAALKMLRRREKK
jgi:hypothetical protein